MKITVVTAVYNAKDTVVNAIESVLNQSYSNVETIVIDGGSTDGTKEIIEEYRDRLDLFISEPDNGIYDAFNKGIKYATGDIVGFLNADDLYDNIGVLSCIAEAFSTSGIEAVYGDLVYVYQAEPDKVIRYWKSGTYSLSKLKYGWMPPHPTFYVRRSIYEMVGGFDVSFHIASDYDCMLRILGHHKICCKYIPQTFVKMRLGGVSNRSLSNIILKSREDYTSLRKNEIGGLWALIWKNCRKLIQFFQR